MSKETGFVVQYHSSLFSAVQYFIYLPVVVICLLFCISQRVTVRTMLPAPSSSSLHIGKPIQGEYNCEYSIVKKESEHYFFSHSFSFPPVYPYTVAFGLPVAFSQFLCCVASFPGISPRTPFQGGSSSWRGPQWKCNSFSYCSRFPSWFLLVCGFGEEDACPAWPTHSCPFSNTGSARHNLALRGELSSPDSQFPVLTTRQCCYLLFSTSR